MATVKESQIIEQIGSYWILDADCQYTVYKDGVTHAKADSSYPHSEDGLFLAKARFSYLCKKG